MKQTFPIGQSADKHGVTLDLPTLVDTRMLVQANSGGGKSWLLRLIAERAAGQTQMIILDPEGEFATLREKIDIALVGRDGEIATDVRAANLIARKLVELRVSAVIDLYDLRIDERRRFVKLFLEALMNVPRALWHPLLVILDEAHLFAPERSAGEAESTSAVIALMSQGRKRGFAGILSTQRLSKLHKDAAAEANNVVIGRTWLDTDQQRAGDLLGMDKPTRQTLRDLNAGEFFAFGPAFNRNGVFRFTSDTVTTTHPKAGQRHLIQAPRASAAIQEIVMQLGDLPAQAEQEINDLNAARQEVAKLKRELNARPTLAVPQIETKIERVEIPMLRPEETAMLAQFQENAARTTLELQAAIAQISGVAQTIKQAIDTAALTYQKAQALAVTTRPVSQNAIRYAARQDAQNAPGVDAALGAGERTVLRAIAQYPGGVSRDTLTVLTGYKRSSRDTYIQRLAARGYVSVERDTVTATAEGVAMLGPSFEPLPTGTALQMYWLERLTGGEKEIFKAVLDAYPHWIDRDRVSEITGYKRSSRDTYIQRLGARRLLQSKPAAVKASDTLF